MLQRSAANRYALALFQLARELKVDPEVEAALVELSRALQASPGTERTLMDPRLSLAEKRRIFSKMYESATAPAAKLLLDFTSVLFEKRRFGAIHDIALEFKLIADEAQGESVAYVRTAQVLDGASEARILSLLEKQTGTKVVIRKEVDPALLGGVQVRIGNRMMDGSVQGNLSRMKEVLLRKV